MDVLNWVLIALSVPLIVAMVMYTLRRAYELDRRIDEYHEEQEAAKDQAGPVNPYEQMAKLYGGEADSGERMADGPDPIPNTQHPSPDSEERSQ